jgi:uncharacterized repeat protein (TIGR02543 family)
MAYIYGAMKNMCKKCWMVIIIIIVSVVVLSSCDVSPLKRDEPTYTSGIFIYRVYKESGIEKARIIDISHKNELGRLDSIVFPTIIDGKKVGYIGDYRELGDGLKEQYFKYTFNAVGKVYIPAEIVVECKFKIGNNNTLKLFWLDGEKVPPRIVDKIYIPFERYAGYDLLAVSGRVLHKANISFKYNFGGVVEEPNYGYYWIDHLEEGEKLVAFPSAPRRDGYNFEGWYTEAECINTADFDVLIKENAEEETIFYAKWKEDYK